MKRYLLFFLTVLILSCSSEKKKIIITPEDYHKTVDKVTSVMIHDIFSPPVASRIYAYPSIASYETLIYNNEKYNSLSGQLNELKPLNYDSYTKEVNLELSSLIAYIDVAKELVFSKEWIESYRDSIYSHFKSLNKNTFEQSKKYGLSISEQILTWMEKDQYNETRKMPKFNIASSDISRWQPTPPAFMDGIEPHWNKIRPFVLDSAAQYKPEKHPKFSLKKGSDFYNELIEVYEIKNDLEKTGNKSEKVAIAQFWDCNPYVSVNKGHFMFAAKKITPGAHWIGICKIASKKSNFDFNETVYAYTKTSIAIADAFISCWDEKYRSNLVRPETLINKLIDEDWEPILQTPPFPEYTSGHSVVSGAASVVLTSIYGENFSFDDDTEVAFNLPVRSFTSFKDAAREAAISRLYGGIHYASAVNKGLKQGFNVGNHIVSRINLKK